MIKYIAALITILALLAVFTVVMTKLGANYPQIGYDWHENANSNIINQTIAIAVLFIMGLIVLLPERKRIGTTQMLLLSFIVGLLVFEFISSLLLIFHIYYSLLTVMIIYCVYTCLLYIFMLKKDRKALAMKKPDATKIVFWALVTFAVGFVLSKVPISILSFDSVEYKNLGLIYVREHYIVDHVIYQMSGHAFIPTLLNSIAAMFSFDFAYGLQNMFVVMSLLLFGYLLFDKTRERGLKDKRAFWYALPGFLLLATSFFVVYLGVCLVPNIFAGFFMMFLMYYMYRYIKYDDTIDLILSFVFMVAFCFTRVEGPLVAVFIVMYFAHKKIDAKRLVYYTGGLFLVLLAWYLSFFLHVGDNFDSAFLTVDKSALIVGLFLAAGIYIYLKNRFFSKQNEKLFKLFVAAVLVFAVAINLLDISKFMVNTRVMFQNMFFEGLWITAWFGVIILGIFAILLTKKKSFFLEGIIPIFIALMFAIFAFRETSLHINWSDSGNRMMMHIYPLIIFVISDNLISYFVSKEKKLKG